MSSEHSSSVAKLSISAARPGPSKAPTAVAALRGDIGALSLVDLIQWLCDGKNSWSMRFVGQETLATLTISKGELVDARVGSISGKAALVEILAIQAGKFELHRPAFVVGRSLEGSTSSLLMEALEALDAVGLDTDKTHVGDAVPGNGMRAVDLIDFGFQALRSGLLAEAQRCWLRALELEPENKTLRINLRKLARVMSAPSSK